MRDYIRNEEYFNKFIEEDSNRVTNLSKKLNDNEVRPERIMPVRQGIFRIKLGVIIAKYSRGDDLTSLKDDFIEIYKEWVNDFLSPHAYNENLRMISLAVLFGVGSEMRELVSQKLKENHVNDWLIHFLLGESQTELELMFQDRFHTLKELNKSSEQAILLKRYLDKEWYNKDCDCYEAHKSKQNIYYGYWSFEAGAIAKILNLDDSSLKDVPYYPYDLVHYKK